jgi:all-trans-retinol 13,14-reductase
MGVSLDPRQAGLDDANVWHYGSDDLDAIYRSIETGGEPAPATYFMTVPTLKDPESQKAPNGHHIVELISGSSLSRFARYQHEKSMRRSQGYEALKRDIADAMIDSAERHYLPGLRKSIVVQEIATPATVKHYVHAHAGGIYGPAHTPAQTLFRRFTPWVGVPGVTLAGSSVLGAGVVSCTVSGVAAAALTQRHLTKVTARSRSAGGFVPSMRASTGAAAPMSP